MTEHNASPSTPAGSLGSKMLALVLTRFNADMQNAQRTIFANTFAQVVLGDPAAAQALKLRDLAALIQDPTHGPNLGEIGFYDLLLAVIDQRAALKAESEKTAEVQAAPEKTSKAATKPEKPKKPGKGKTDKGASAAPAAAPTSRKGKGQNPPEYDAVVSKVLAALKKSDEGLKINEITPISGYEKPETSKILAKLIEEGKVKKEGAGPGTRYLAAS